jgi:hypothetical protein
MGVWTGLIWQNLVSTVPHKVDNFDKLQDY